MLKVERNSAIPTCNSDMLVKLNMAHITCEVFLLGSSMFTARAQRKQIFVPSKKRYLCKAQWMYSSSKLAACISTYKN